MFAHFCPKNAVGCFPATEQILKCVQRFTLMHEQSVSILMEYHIHSYQLLLTLFIHDSCSSRFIIEFFKSPLARVPLLSFRTHHATREVHPLINVGHFHYSHSCSILPGCCVAAPASVPPPPAVGCCVVAAVAAAI